MHYIIYLNPSLDHREALIRELTQGLKQIRLPGTDEPLAQGALRREDIHSGDYVDQAPDLYVKAQPGVFVSNRLKQDSDFFCPKESLWKAHHAPQGMFLLSGPSVRRGAQLDEVSLMDLAPTIMHLLELHIPNDMDGRLILEAFDAQSRVRKRKPRYRLVEGNLAGGEESAALLEWDDEAILDRLRGMGYVE